MSLFRKREKTTEFRNKDEQKAFDRLRTIADFEVLNWSEQAVNTLHQTLDTMRKPERRVDMPAALEEARRAVSMLSGAVGALEARYRS